MTEANPNPTISANDYGFRARQQYAFTMKSGKRFVGYVTLTGGDYLNIHKRNQSGHGYDTSAITVVNCREIVHATNLKSQ